MKINLISYQKNTIRSIITLWLEWVKPQAARHMLFVIIVYSIE